MDVNFVIGCCWFLQDDIGLLLALLQTRPGIAADSRIGSINIQRFNPNEFP